MGFDGTRSAREVEAIGMGIIVAAFFVFLLLTTRFGANLVANGLAMGSKQGVLHACPSILVDITFGIDNTEGTELGVTIVDSWKG